MVPRKRPCRICRRWFSPHPRAGDRQHVCSEPACQRARHRKADRAWHARNPDYDKKRRLRESAGLPEPVTTEEAPEDPLAGLDWQRIERAIGPKPRVVVEGVGRLLLQHAQDAVPPRRKVVTAEGPRLLNTRSQDAVAAITGVEPLNSGQVPPKSRKTQSAELPRGP